MPAFMPDEPGDLPLLTLPERLVRARWRHTLEELKAVAERQPGTDSSRATNSRDPGSLRGD